MSPPRLLTLALAIALAGSTACSRKAAGCSGKISGAASGSFTCNVAIRNSGGDVRLLITPVQVPREVGALSLPDLELPLPVAPGKDYSLSATTKARTLVTAPGHRTFIAEKSKEGQRGGMTLRFAKVDVGKAHEVASASGTLVARLVPDAGEGEVVIDLTF